MGTRSKWILFVLLAYGFAADLNAQPQPRPDVGPLRFTHLTLEDGLAQQSVFSILQDRHGFMWFGTVDALIKYDGYRSTVYQHDPNDPNSLSTSAVRVLLEDRDGMIWIGHDSGGLSRFDPVTETFTHYRHDEGDPHSLSHDEVRILYEDRRGTPWVGTQSGLDRFEAATETFTNLVPDPKGLAPAGAVWAILEDTSGTFWLGVGQGLSRYDASVGARGTFKRFLFASEEQTFLGPTRLQRSTRTGRARSGWAARVCIASTGRRRR